MSPRTGDGEVSLGYEIDELPGADRLLVLFPKLNPGGAKPPVRQRAHLISIRAHRLFLGADRYYYIGPKRSMAGARLAADLISATMKRLAVDRSRVVALGTSMGAIDALVLGLRGGAGQIIAGAPPVDMGRQLRRFEKFEGTNSAAKASAGEFLSLARNGTDEDPADFFDRLIVENAEATTQPTRIDLFVSEEDHSYKQTRRLWKQLAGHPQIECSLHLSDYGHHANIKGPFFDFVREQLSAAPAAQLPELAPSGRSS